MAFWVSVYAWNKPVQALYMCNIVGGLGPWLPVTVLHPDLPWVGRKGVLHSSPWPALPDCGETCKHIQSNALAIPFQTLLLNTFYLSHGFRLGKFWRYQGLDPWPSAFKLDALPLSCGPFLKMATNWNQLWKLQRRIKNKEVLKAKNEDVERVASRLKSLEFSSFLFNAVVCNWILYYLSSSGVKRKGSSANTAVCSIHLQKLLLFLHEFRPQNALYLHLDTPINLKGVGIAMARDSVWWCKYCAI